MDCGNINSIANDKRSNMMSGRSEVYFVRKFTPDKKNTMKSVPLKHQHTKSDEFNDIPDYKDIDIHDPPSRSKSKVLNQFIWWYTNFSIP